MPATRDGIPRWEHYAHEADIGVRGIGATREQSFKDVIVAAHMRDRYNALDFLYATGQMDAFGREAFGL